MLKVNNTLTILNLPNNSLKNEGFACIVNGIVYGKGSCFLSINVSKNELTSKCMNDIGRLVQQSEVERIIMNQNHIGDKGCEELASCLGKRNCDSINYLSLESCGIRFPGLLKLFIILEKMINLETIVLNKNHFIDVNFINLKKVS